jgi:hypothetical protein
MKDLPGTRFGSEVGLVPTSNDVSSLLVYSGAPDQGSTDTGMLVRYNYAGGGLTGQTNIGSLSSRTNAHFGDRGTFVSSQNRILAGSPGGPGNVYLYDRFGNYQGLELAPYRFDSSNGGRTVSETSGVGLDRVPRL